MLTHGSTIALVAPSGIFHPQRLQQGINMLESWGYQVQASPNLHQRHLSMAGTPEQRISDIKWSHENPDVSAVWFARGGYGTAQLLHQIPKNYSKPTFGFSDATAFGSLMRNRGAHNFFHAPVVHSLHDLCDAKTQEATKIFLQTGSLPSMEVLPLHNPAPCSGKLAGGNLCVLSSLLGTPYQLNAKGCILMLEDIAEPAYKIHRMLLQMRLTHAFDGVQGIVFGSFHNCSAPEGHSLNDFILDALQGIDIPMFHNAPFGHGSENLLWNVNQFYTLKDGVLQCGSQ